MRALCALYVLERLLHVVTHPRLVNFLAAALLLGAVQPRHRASAPALASVAAAQRGDAAEDAAEVPGLSLISCSGAYCIFWWRSRSGPADACLRLEQKSCMTLPLGFYSAAVVKS